jgi:hypothetical protein
MTKISTIRQVKGTEVVTVPGKRIICDTFYDRKRTQYHWDDSFVIECEAYPDVRDNAFEEDVKVGFEFSINSDHYRVKDIVYEIKVRIATIKEEAFFPSTWSMGDKGSLTTKAGSLLIIAQQGFYHSFPMKGKYVKSQKGADLFFVDEEKGTQTLTETKSKDSGRFYSDEVIYQIKKQDPEYIFFRYFKGYGYEITKK